LFEQCDKGTANNTGAYGGCNSDCTLAAHCGDGKLSGTDGEKCDDGNVLNDHNGCATDCTCVNTCDSKCVDFSNDAKNCGACGTACAANQDCVGGVCCTNCNLLRGAINGVDPAGNATVQSISASGGAVPFETNLTEACSQPWFPTGTFCDEGGAGFTDSETRSYHGTTSAGATWDTKGKSTAVGTLVVDLGAVRTLDRFSLFQMFSDGKTQAVHLFSHPALLGAAPAGDDKGWVATGDWVPLGAGELVQTASGDYVTAPAQVTLSKSITTRFLRIDARSPGDNFIELRAVKAFR
jgi:hypothetical protein